MDQITPSPVITSVVEPKELNPVSWQSIVFALLPLALNTLAQPTGQVLGQEAKYRMYLQARPVVVFLDLVDITRRIIYYTLARQKHASFRKAVSLTMHRRFPSFSTQGVRGPDTVEESLLSFKKWRLLRWTLFALCVVQPAIKLAAFADVPWSQAIGFSYLASRIIMEICGFIATDDPFKFYERQYPRLERGFLRALVLISMLASLLLYF